MYRLSALIFTLCVFVTSCRTPPAVYAPGGMVKFGAGSMDDDISAPNKASPPAGVQKVRREEILAKFTVYESDLDAKLAAFDYTGAFAAYDLITEVLGSSPSGTAKLAEVRGKMEKALDAIVFEAVSNPLETVAGTPFKKDFSIRVYALAQDVKKPLEGFACEVSFPSAAEDGTKITASRESRSAADGLVSFSAPVPAASGRNTLMIASSLNCADAVLRDSLAARKERGQLAVAFPHVVSTSAKQVGTTISILDYDKNGKAVLSGNISATTLLKPLVMKGFRRIGMADFPKELASGDEAALLKAAKALFGNGVQRFVYGTARIESVSKGEDLLWSCTFVMQVSVWDFTLGSKVYSTEIRDTQTGKTEAGAIDAARKKVCGDLMVNDLTYNM
jgi:hypothetical protein